MAGDIYARILIEKHKVFERKGADLFMEKKISLLEALTGFSFELEHLNGQKYIVATSPGEVINPGRE
jgi:DnaJ family protein A protein 2